MPLAKQRSKSLQHPDGADGAAKPPWHVAGAGRAESLPQRDMPSHSTVTFVIWRVTSILCSDHAVYEAAQFTLASVMHQEPTVQGPGNEKNTKLPP